MSPAKPKAVALLSTGLDSALAIRILVDQGFEVLALHALNPFDDPDGPGVVKARRNAKRLGVEVRVVEKGPDFVAILNAPKHGVGSGVNPCIDCRIHLLKLAKQVMLEIGAGVIVTGEVVGQRPMSQLRQQLDFIEKRAEVQGLLLRPLSALHFEPTEVERAGLIERDRLFDIIGRGRGRQLDLARQWGLDGIESGGGGCLLTDKNYAARVRDFKAQQDELCADDFRRLSMGRHFRFDSETKAVVGRDDPENERLRRLIHANSRLYKPVNFNGPSVLLEGAETPRNQRRAFRLMSAYAKRKVTLDGRPAAVEIYTIDQDTPRQVPFKWETVMKSDLDPNRIER